MKQRQQPETIGCHDCGNAVSFTAKACPSCGSTEPSGPYLMSRREVRGFRREARNDHNLAVFTLICGLLGAIYGYETAASLFGSILALCFYGAIGVLVGVPIGFAANIWLNYLHPLKRRGSRS